MNDDLISRDAVIYYIKGHIHEIITESGEDKNAHTNRVLRALINGVETMPPVNPQEPCEDANANQHNSNALNDVGQHTNAFEGDLISRQAVLDGIEELKKSPWATDKRCEKSVIFLNR